MICAPQSVYDDLIVQRDPVPKSILAEFDGIYASCSGEFTPTACAKKERTLLGERRQTTPKIRIHVDVEGCIGQINLIAD